VLRFSDPERLGRAHVLDGFECGVPSLDVWLRDHARAAAGAGSARTYVVTDAEQGRVVGYYALAVASSERDQAPERVSKGMPRHPLPVVVLARLAVDGSVQGEGIGGFLLGDAMLRTVAAAEEVGIRALLVHAQDDRARSFYLHHGFEPAPTDDLHLMILVKDIRRTVEDG
jgi:GNAT superfamily N-acetyltransferase